MFKCSQIKMETSHFKSLILKLVSAPNRCFIKSGTSSPMVPFKLISSNSVSTSELVSRRKLFQTATESQNLKSTPLLSTFQETTSKFKWLETCSSESLTTFNGLSSMKLDLPLTKLLVLELNMSYQECLINIWSRLKVNHLCMIILVWITK